jgi:hypothetical protein
MKRKSKKLDAEKIREIVETVDDAAKKSGAKYAVMGGACFVLFGLPYTTEDIDMAADGDIADGLLPLVENPNAFSWNKNGHYMVSGVKVDFVHKLSDGTSRLFAAAVKNRVRHRGVWCCRLSDAAAIRLAAGRPKDFSVLRNLIRLGEIDIASVARTVLRHAPASKGADEARKVLGKKSPFINLAKELKRHKSQRRK